MDKKKVYAIILTVLIFVCGGMGWYFMYYTKTPTYSLNLIREAVQKHDVQSFKQHVDLDSMLSRAVDSYMAHSLQNGEEMKNNPFNGLAEGFINMVKPALVSAMKDVILKQVEGSPGTTNNNSSAQQGMPANLQQIEKNAGIQSMEFKSIAYEKKDGKIATVGISVSEVELPENFTFDVKMSELNDGTWQVVEVSNVAEYLTKLNQVRKVVLKKYIDEVKPINAALNKRGEEWEKRYPDLRSLNANAIEELSRSQKEYFDAVSKIDVPFAAQEFNRLIKEHNDIRMNLQIPLLRRYVAGERGERINRELQEMRDAFKKNREEIAEIINSVKGIN